MHAQTTMKFAGNSSNSRRLLEGKKEFDWIVFGKFKIEQRIWIGIHVIDFRPIYLFWMEWIMSCIVLAQYRHTYSIYIEYACLWILQLSPQLLWISYQTHETYINIWMESRKGGQSIDSWTTKMLNDIILGH